MTAATLAEVRDRVRSAEENWRLVADAHPSPDSPPSQDAFNAWFHNGGYCEGVRDTLAALGIPVEE